MAGCTSDPTAGCDNNEIVAAIDAQTTTIAALITTGNATMASILASIEACCVETNANLAEEVSLLTAINAKL